MYFKVQKCSIVLLVAFLAGVASDFCFRNRAPAGPFGRCDDMIPNINTARQCCRAGGAGWTEKQNGKRCGSACSGNDPTTVSPEEEPTTTQPPAEVKLCFRTREPRGIMGSCGDLMGERTREDCCRQGGKGWTDRRNGKRCENACHGVVHGGWSEWGDWDQCSKSCGEGIQTRRRRCNNPAPENGGDDCVGPNSEQAICDEGPCPIHGGWGDWRNAGECSATCYYEGHSVYRHMRRRCNNPVPQYGGDDCRGPARKNVVCLDLPHCPVDGGWSDYGEWSDCSQTCEEGIQTRIRTCTNPRPQNGGLECEGDDTERQVCRNRRVCPGEGSGSGDGSGALDIFPCDDEEVCQPRAGGNEIENSFFESLGDSI